MAQRHRRQLGERTDDRPDAGDGARRLVRLLVHGGPERVLERLDGEQLVLRVAQRRRPLDRDVAQRGGARRRRPEHVGCEPAPPRARLDDDERVGLALVAPRLVQRTRHERTEQGADLGAGHEVAPRPARAPATGEEPVVLVVEGGVDEPVEGDRPFAPDPLGEQRAQPGNANSPTRANSCGYTPITRTTSIDSVSAMPSAGGVADCVVSTPDSSGERNHILRATAA